MQKATSDYLDSLPTSGGVSELYAAAKQAIILAKGESDRPSAGALLLLHFALLSIGRKREDDTSAENWEIWRSQIEMMVAFVKSTDTGSLAALAELID